MAFTPRKGARLVLAAVMWVVGTVPLSACQDTQGDPLALAVAPETHGALLLAQALPSVPLLLSQVGVDPEQSADVEAWWESWSMDEREGERVRSSIYPSASRRLYPALGREGVTILLARNGDNLAAVQDAGILVGTEALRTSLSQARALHQRAETALRAGDGVGALALALQSVDAQWAVSPPQVAASLLDDAHRFLGRIDAAHAYSEEQLGRIRRLMSGAEEALQAGDFSRAIRRAYYACQLLGVGPPS